MMRATVESAPSSTRFFGQFLLARGLITAQQLIAAVEYQNKYNSRLGELAVALGMVTPFDAEQINALQSKEDLLFGEAALRLGLLTKEQLDQVLDTQKDSHVRLGQALEALGFLDPVTLGGALGEFMDEEQSRLQGLPKIPTDFPALDMAQALTALSPKMLLRTWNLQTKADALRKDGHEVVLSDINAAARGTAGGRRVRLVIGVPYAAAHKIAQGRRAGDGDSPNLQAMACDFLDLLCSHVASVQTEQGQRLSFERAIPLSSRVPLDDAHSALLFPYLTHLGRVIVGLIA